MEITFDKSTASWVLQTFKDIPNICFSCKKKITIKNFGGVLQGKGMFCKKFPCLVALVDAQKENMMPAVSEGIKPKT